MQDTLQAAREQARQWREAKGDGATDGFVLILDGMFVGWMAELPPAAHWVSGCLAIAGDGHAHCISHDWCRPLEWTDLDPPVPEAEATPPPSSGSPSSTEPPEPSDS